MHLGFFIDFNLPIIIYYKYKSRSHLIYQYYDPHQFLLKLISKYCIQAQGILVIFKRTREKKSPKINFTRNFQKSRCHRKLTRRLKVELNQTNLFGLWHAMLSVFRSFHFLMYWNVFGNDDNIYLNRNRKLLILFWLLLDSSSTNSIFLGLHFESF